MTDVPGFSPSQEADKDRLLVVGQASFQLSGDVHQLVTFLNRSLKDDDYIFGLRRAEDGRFQLTIYRT